MVGLGVLILLLSLGMLGNDHNQGLLLVLSTPVTMTSRLY